MTRRYDNVDGRDASIGLYTATRRPNYAYWRIRLRIHKSARERLGAFADEGVHILIGRGRVALVRPSTPGPRLHAQEDPSFGLTFEHYVQAGQDWTWRETPAVPLKFDARQDACGELVLTPTRQPAPGAFLDGLIAMDQVLRLPLPGRPRGPKPRPRAEAA